MILFTAGWCSPCQQVKQYLKDKYNGVLEVKVIDIDNDVDGLAQTHKIKSIPTLIDGEQRIYSAQNIIEQLELVTRDI